jgi:hypothetical protein
MPKRAYEASNYLSRAERRGRASATGGALLLLSPRKHTRKSSDSRLLVSAVGAPQVNPTREGWESAELQPEHRRCGTSLFPSCSPFYSLPTTLYSVPNTTNSHQTNGLQFILDNQYQYVIIGVSIGTRTLSVLPQIMRLRRAVPKIPAKSSVPPRLPLHKSRTLPTSSKSTLAQLLIPLHFNSRICNAYKKAGEGIRPSNPKFCNSSLLPLSVGSLVTRHSSLATVPLTPSPATLTRFPQSTENKTTLRAIMHFTQNRLIWPCRDRVNANRPLSLCPLARGN